MSVHVPAWKRLGLKLKYANEELEKTSADHLRKSNDDDSQESGRSVKRRRIAEHNGLSTSAETTSPSTSIGQTQAKVLETPKRSTPLSKTSATELNRPLQRKKSVTFTEETKREDGDSRKTIDFPAGSPGSTPNRPAKTVNDSVHTATSIDTAPTKRNKTKAKAVKGSRLQKGPIRDKTESALDYLTQHRTNRDAWKFNKILDVWILNHTLNTQAIPSTHLSALAGYIRGLPEKAGSRTRLIKECRDLRAETQLEEHLSEHEQSWFIQFIDSGTDALEDKEKLEAFLQSHSRPVLLLWALGEEVSGSTNGKVSQESSSVVVKKKKSRTAAPVDISSSSESDSDSDLDSSSSGDSSDSAGAQKVVTRRDRVQKGVGQTDREDTLSSGTSSSQGEDSTSSNESSSEEEEED